HRRKAPLYVALREYARAGTDENLRERCRRFSGKMEEYRRLATALPADQLIHRLLEETGLLAAAAARVNGEQRLANLRLLHDFARRFEQGKFRGLSAFVRYVDRLEEQREDLAPASTLSGQSNVVRIISVHHSKGLEFPVVFLAGMGHKFNNDSTKGDLLLQSDQGIGLVWRDPATRRQYDTLPREAVKLAIRQAERAEDLRVLYVAMTRAKEKLCMVATCADVAKMLSKMAATVGDRPTVSAYALQNAASMGEWMMMAALRHPSGEELRRLASAPDLPVLPCDTPWEITVCASPAVTQAKTQAESPLPDPALTARYQQRLAYRYPYAALAAIPSKLAASALSHEALETRHVAEQRPAFLERQPLSAAGRGTAMHTFMERADFHRAGQDVRREADRLALEGVLTADQRQSLNVRRLAGFFESELCARMLASPRWLREQAFTVELPPAFFGYAAPEDMPNEKIVVQGIADSVFWEDGEWVIVDYKTDAVKTGAELVERYRDQLRIYKAALEQTLSRPVRECWLYAFSLGEAIKCDL
ncbi:MAG: 3'-5' exonuclease, partial [Acutalibacteraceae bacterium]